MERPVEFYRDSSRFDEIWIRYQEIYGQDPDLVRFVHNTLQSLGPLATVLDIGCGTGKPVCDMAAQSGRSVTGIDYSSTMIRLSRQQVPTGTFHHVNMLDYEPSEKFDAAYSSFTLLVFTYDGLQNIMARIGSWIADGGSLFIVTLSPNMSSNGCPPDANGTKIVDSKFFGVTTPVLLPTVDGWSKILAKAGLEMTDAYEKPWVPSAEADPRELQSEVHLFITAKRLASECD